MINGQWATQFGGTADYYALASDMNGCADGKDGTCSFWFQVGGKNLQNRRILANESYLFYIGLSSGNTFVWYGKSGVVRLLMISNTAITPSLTWRHAMASWKLSTATGHVYIDDTEDQAAGSTLQNAAIDYTRVGWAAGALQTGQTPWIGGLTQVYFALEYLDLSVEANRRKFYTAAGKAANLGANGSTPTGTQPIFYAPDGNASNNLGSGGNFAAVGAPKRVLGLPSVRPYWIFGNAA